jgi:hypothetical protein
MLSMDLQQASSFVISYSSREIEQHTYWEVTSNQAQILHV